MKLTHKQPRRRKQIAVADERAITMLEALLHRETDPILLRRAGRALAQQREHIEQQIAREEVLKELIAESARLGLYE